ncbi:MAG: hypothetical protein WKG01_27790 [Kofleriaceae bacterium]
MRPSTKLLGWPLLAGLASGCDAPRPFVGFDALPCLPDAAKHDEDGDGFPDSCDVCPLVVDPRQLDTSEGEGHAFPDGVGDECDLLPRSSGDDLVVLHTFADPSTSKWEGSGWSIAGDQASAAGDASWRAIKIEEGDGLVVQLRVASWGPAGELRVGADGDAMTRGMVCVLARDREGDGQDELVVSQFNGETATKSVPPLGGDFILMIWRYINGEREGTVRCTLLHADAKYEVSIPAPDASDGGYVFAATGIAAISAVAVYTQPVAPCAEPARCPMPAGD